MLTTIIKAHFDGEHVVLDEPFNLQPNAPLLVTVFGPDAERAQWTALGVQNMARAYGPDEPDYNEADLKPR
jgi:hypothetical protein